MGYKLYEKIIKKHIPNITLDDKTIDYDFSFSLKNSDESSLQIMSFIDLI
jgi:hypothetical protein